MVSRLLLFITILVTYRASAQSISGYVYDEATNQPLENAFVYLDGTSISADTDVHGRFNLPTGTHTAGTLVISYIGFETARVENPFQYKKALKIMLKESAEELKEVTIIANTTFTRKQMLKAFRDEFLGKSAAGRSCRIENEDDVKLYYDTGTNTLYATALKPLRIVNKRLKYNMQFDLMHFQVNYHAKSLKSYDINTSFFAGSTYFKDVAVGKSADNKRKEAYLGSPAHLMRTIASNDWQKQGFTLYVRRLPAEPAEYFEVKDTMDIKKVKLIKSPNQGIGMKMDNALTAEKARQPEQPGYTNVKFNLMYNGKQSYFILNRGYFFIDKHGQYNPIDGLLFGGHMSTLKAGDMLPAEYKPD